MYEKYDTEIRRHSSITKEITFTQYHAQGLGNVRKDFKALSNQQIAGITYDSRWHKEVTSPTIDNGEI